MGCCNTSSNQVTEFEVNEVNELPALQSSLKINEPFDFQSLCQAFETTHNTFVELILIYRILFSSNNENEMEKDDNKEIESKKKLLTQSRQDKVNKLLLLLPDIDECKDNECRIILTALQNDGLLKYLKKGYNDKQIEYIDYIFNYIIMSREYMNIFAENTSPYGTALLFAASKSSNTLVSSDQNVDIDIDIDILYNDGKCDHIGQSGQSGIILASNDNSINDSNKYYCMVFHQPDLVPFIFGFLHFGSINNASKVNLLWLYHAFNKNSLYYINVADILYCQHLGEMKNSVCPSYKSIRLWQRFCGNNRYVNDGTALKNEKIELRESIGMYILFHFLTILKFEENKQYPLSNLDSLSSNHPYCVYNQRPTVSWNINTDNAGSYQGVTCRIYIYNVS